MKMIENVEIFMIYSGFTLFIVGAICCFIAVSFRFGVLCTLLGNTMLYLGTIFSRRTYEFMERVGISDFFNHDLDELKVKAVVTAVILMTFLWSVRWVKHFVVDGVFYFLFPNVIKPQIKKSKA
jgi:hypothetical protein